MRREVAAEVGDAYIPPIPNWDSNVITPGTAFMAKLAASLRAFLHAKLAADPAWQHIQARAPRLPHKELGLGIKDHAAPASHGNVRGFHTDLCADYERGHLGAQVGGRTCLLSETALLAHSMLSWLRHTQLIHCCP